MNFQATRGECACPGPNHMCACPSSACEHARHRPRIPTPVSAPLRPLCLQPSISLSLALFSTRSALAPGLPCICPALALLQQLNSPRPLADSWGNTLHMPTFRWFNNSNMLLIQIFNHFQHRLARGSPIDFELIVALVAHVGGARPTQQRDEFSICQPPQPHHSTRQQPRRASPAAIAAHPAHRPRRRPHDRSVALVAAAL